MNRAILMGRLTRDPEVRYTSGERSMAVARYTLACDRRGRNNSGEQQTADFINIVAFDKAGEFAERISARACAFWCLEESRLAATQIKKARRSTRRISW